LNDHIEKLKKQILEILKDERQIFPNTGLFGFFRKIQRWYPEYTMMRKRWKNMLRLKG